MSFYEFEDDDKIFIRIKTFPEHQIVNDSDNITGSVYLESNYQSDDLTQRTYYGFSERLGGYTQKYGPFSASISFSTATQGGTNNEMYHTILKLYDYYGIVSPYYTASFSASHPTSFRVIQIPEVYYDRSILSASFRGLDVSGSSDTIRNVYDNGFGAILSGSGIVGNIFYNEGLVVFKDPTYLDFASVSSTNLKWQVDFKGEHSVPCVVFKCRAPAGELLGSTNSSYSQVNTDKTSDNFGAKESVLEEPHTYITAVGLYNENYELVGYAKVAQPIKKSAKDSILFRLKMDF